MSRYAVELKALPATRVVTMRRKTLVSSKLRAKSL